MRLVLKRGGSVSNCLLGYHEMVSIPKVHDGCKAYGRSWNGSGVVVLSVEIPHTAFKS
jgi:hypothetical protein